MKTGIIFDLDGTLLDTLQDLYENVNVALEAFGYPLRTKEEVKNFVGNGIELLMRRALPKEIEEPRFQEVFRYFQKVYTKNLNRNTLPYPGIMEMIEELKKRNVLLGVVSNKFQVGVEKLVEEFFPEYIRVAVGNAPGLKKKPAPDSVFAVLERLGLNWEEDLIYYAGDSEVDILTARAAGLPVISVTWGFKTREFLESFHPDFLVDSPGEITQIIEKVIK